MQKPYDKPSIVDHGSLKDLTAAGLPEGHADADYNQGDPLPAGGGGDSSTPLP